MNYLWGNNRRINLASAYLKRNFGKRLQKVTIDAGFTCPNRDGTVSTGGCAFCNNDAFSPSYCTPDKSVEQQIREGIDFHTRRYKSANGYLAYFQAYSNTYAGVDRLEAIFKSALEFPEIKGLIIGTRPDCIDAQKLELLARLNERSRVVVEYGIETINENTLKYINRGHTFGQAVEALELTAKYKLPAGAHIVFGFPGETREEMEDSVEVISQLPLHSIKFHQLQIVKGTRFEKEYIENPSHFDLFELDEYIVFISRFLSRLNPSFVVERIAGETQPRNNVGKMWNIRYDQVLQRVEKYMEENDLWQGKYFDHTVKQEISA